MLTNHPAQSAQPSPTLILLIFALASQFHIYSPWVNSRFCEIRWIVCSSISSREGEYCGQLNSSNIQKTHTFVKKQLLVSLSMKTVKTIFTSNLHLRLQTCNFVNIHLMISKYKNSFIFILSLS